MKNLMFFLFFLLPFNISSQPTTDKQPQDNIETKQWEIKPEKISISGIVLTPTAYRSNGINEIGPSIDFNAAYYIGRLYGKNTFDWTVDKKNYLDRVGIWYFESDGKLLIQRENKIIPSFASGFKGIFTFRDSPQPSLNTPQTSFKINNKNTNVYSALYFVASKHITQKLIVSIGYSEGDFSKLIYQISEFLSNDAIKITTGSNPYISNSTIFAGAMYIIKEKNPLGFEIIIPQGSTLNPKLINFQFGNLLKLNFQISYLNYKGGYEYLGTFSFRYSLFPKIRK